MKEFHTIPLSQIRATRLLAFEEATTEVIRVRNKLTMKEKPWNREYRDKESYYHTFRSVLECQEISSILREMKKNKSPGEKLVVMDARGTGSVLENLPQDARPDTIIAMTLVDYLTKEKKDADIKQGLYIIETYKDDVDQLSTSVALPHTWIAFEKLLKELGVKSIDFAVARPLGGMHTIPAEYPWFLAWMAQKVYKHLNPSGGMLLTEAPQNQNTFLLQWSEQVRQRGLDVVCKLITKDRDFQPIRAALKIIKHPDSPVSLSQA